MTVATGPQQAPSVLDEVTRLLLLEARLLDEERYEEWLGLLTEDVHYWVPGVENRLRSDPSGSYGPGRMAYFDDDLRMLRIRVARFASTAAWAEDPPTRHVHVVSNIEVEPAGDAPEEYVAHSVVVNFRSRGELGDDVLYARRRDRLRRVGHELRIARRRVLLGHNVLPAKNLNTFL